MKLSAETLAILKNFAEINGNLTIKPGNVIKTLAESRNIHATAQVAEVFEHTFGFYDIREFLATLAMFPDPELTFSEECVDISDNTDSSLFAKYYSANIAILTRVPELKQFPKEDVKFLVSKTNFNRISRACATLKCPDVKFRGGNGKIEAIVYDGTNATKNTFTIDISKEYDGEPFSVHLKEKRLMLIDGDYECSIISNRVLMCKNTEQELEYIITLDVDTN